MNIYVSQIHVAPDTNNVAFSYKFNELMHHHLSRSVHLGSHTGLMAKPDWTLTIRFVVYPNETSGTEVKGPQIFKRSKDMEYAIHIRGQSTREGVLSELFRGIVSVCQSIGLEAHEFEALEHDIQNQVFDSANIMFETRM